jgi:solute carrier family 20 (sodium-dependent phosphate transporter)
LIGANDVANAFASSVSSGSITLKQAVLIASVCEFSGAFFLGASVTGTIRSKIVSTDLYKSEPEVLLFGMFTSLLSAILLLFIATHFGIPVSTTHDIVGCIMGFSIAAKGFDSIQWDVVKKIMLSWVASPLLSGAVGFILFGLVKYFIMTSANPFDRAFWAFPVVLTVGIGIDMFYCLYKASSNFAGFQKKLSLAWVLPVSFGSGAFLGLLWIVIFGPIAKRRVEAHNSSTPTAYNAKAVPHPNKSVEENVEKKVVDDFQEVTDYDDIEKVAPKEEPAVSVDNSEQTAIVDQPTAPEQPARTGFLGAMDRFGAATYNQDLHAQSMHESKRAAELWDDCEKFDENAEGLFTYVQVFTACLNSFAHGANDVSNTIAPLSAIIQIYRDGKVSSKSKVQKWVLAYGGIAIVAGLLLYGYRVMKSIGYKMTMLSPSRGASAELAASLIVVTASFNNLPVSSTQCIVGGVGLVGGVKNVQWLFLLRVCVSWVFLFFLAVVVSAGVFSFGAFSPSLV